MKSQTVDPERQGHKEDSLRTFSKIVHGAEANPETTSLPTGMRSEMERDLSVGMGDVQVRTNDHSVDAQGAKARTVGNEISFGIGQYQPGTAGGRELIRHEATHVAQNRSPEGTTGTQGDREAQASSVGSGGRAEALHAGAPGQPQFDIKSDLRDAFSVWGTDDNRVLRRLGSASVAELQVVLGDGGLMEELKSHLSRAHMEQAMDVLHAPLADKLRLAIRGWGNDKAYLLRALNSSPMTEIQHVLADATLMNQLRSALSRTDMEEVLDTAHAPLRTKIEVGTSGWFNDQDYLRRSLQTAPRAELVAVAQDHAYFDRLRSQLSRETFNWLFGEVGPSIPIADRLNMAMDGWGVDRDFLFQQLQLATQAEKTSVLGNATLMARLRTKLSKEDFELLLTGLNAPLRDRLIAALTGWSVDDRFIYDTVTRASDAEKTAILHDQPLMAQLRGRLTREQVNRLLEDLNAPLADKINFALDGWGADTEYIRRTLAQASAADKAALQVDRTFMQRLQARLSTAEIQAAFGATPGMEAVALFQAGRAVDAAILLGRVPANAKVNMNGFDALNSVITLMGGVPRGRAEAQDLRVSLGNMIMADDNFARMTKVFETRWDVNLSTTVHFDPAINPVGAVPPPTPNWTPQLLQDIHQRFNLLPQSHMDNQQMQRMLLYAGDNSTGGAFGGGEFDVGVGMGAGSGAGNTTQYGDQHSVGAQGVHATNWTGAVVRHEMGHSVEGMLGSRTNSLKQGLGGWWEGGEVERWTDGMDPFHIARPQPGQPAAIPDADQGAIKTAIAAYLAGTGLGGAGSLVASVPVGHALRTWEPSGVNIIEAAKQCEGQGMGFFSNADNFFVRGSRCYTMNFYYHHFMSFDAGLKQHYVRNYMLFAPAEFFAELYCVYYEDGPLPVNQLGSRIPVPEWKQWFDRNVNAAGYDPGQVVTNNAGNPGATPVGAGPNAPAP